MMTPAEIASAARRLDEAERTRKQIRMLSLDHPGMDMADAYAVQKAWIDLKIAAGRRILGHKIGLTSKAMQSALNIDMPDSGVLLDDMFFADGAAVKPNAIASAAVPATAAFRTRRAALRRVARFSVESIMAVAPYI